jgi:hypothetical protein
MKVDIDKERKYLQRIYSDPQTDAERCFKNDFMTGSAPAVWHDELIVTCHWVHQVYMKSWNSCRDTYNRF